MHHPQLPAHPQAHGQGEAGAHVEGLRQEHLGDRATGKGVIRITACKKFADRALEAQ